MENLQNQLNDFSPEIRSKAVKELAKGLAKGEVIASPEADVANMHCHTFYSFNAYGYSPSGLAWLARQNGYKLIGIVDFDVLDGVDEFLTACEALIVRGTAGLETRVFIPEFSNREINSPGEPGVSYHMGIGFTSSQAPRDVRHILVSMREGAEKRNRDMLERLNTYLAPLHVEYDHDVIPLTPSGNATERHMLAALDRVAQNQFGDATDFWSRKLELTAGDTATLMRDRGKFHNLMRAKLMKKGGVGYVQPEAGSFPTVEEVNRLIMACGALPCAAWLDGTSDGEQAMDELLALLMEKGVVALNIIPDRNWNIADISTRTIKVQKLNQIIQIARDLDLPLNVGTEMNSPGQKKLDDFQVAEIAPLREIFMDGAYCIYGHTMLQRACGLGYLSAWALGNLPERAARNKFYTLIGRCLQPGAQGLGELKKFNVDSTPKDVLSALSL